MPSECLYDSINYEQKYNPSSPINEIVDFTGQNKVVYIPTLSKICMELWAKITLLFIFFVLFPVLGLTLRFGYNAENRTSVQWFYICILIAGFLGLLIFFKPLIIYAIKKPKPGTSSPALRSPMIYDILWKHAEKKILLVLNPISGKKKAKALVEKVVIPMLQNHNIQFEIFETKYSNHAFEYLLKYEQYDIIDAVIVCGGDGTYNEVAAGIFKHFNTAFDIKRKNANSLEQLFETELINHSDSTSANMPAIGIIPVGSANSTFCEFLFDSHGSKYKYGGQLNEHALWSKDNKSIEELIRWSVQRIINGKRISSSLLLCKTNNHNYIACNAAFLGSMNDLNVIAESLRWMGPMRYDVAGVATVFSKSLASSPSKIIFHYVDNTSEILNDKQWFSTINIVKHWKDDMRTVPAAQMNSGVCIYFGCTSSSTVSERMKLLLDCEQASYYNRKYSNAKPWIMRALKKIDIFFDTPGLWCLDGEIYYHNGLISIHTVYRAIQIIATNEEIASSGPIPNNLLL